MGGKIFGIFFIIFILGVMVYASQSGILGKLLSFRTSTSTPPVPAGEPPPPGEAPPPEIIELPPPPPPLEEIDPSQIPQGFTKSDLSPYFQKVRIWGVSGTTSPDVLGWVTLAANFEGGYAINVSGWRLRSNRAGYTVIPKGIKVYDPQGFASESDIYFKSGETLNIYSTTNPLGRNIELNKCVGYLENNLDFNPTLPLYCPDDVDRARISFFTGRCQDYILSLGLCGEPDLNHDDVKSDRDCRAYLEDFELSYKGCVDRHSQDADFLTGEWRVWVGSQFLTPDDRHDRILLLDRGGLLVDLYTY